MDEHVKSKVGSGLPEWTQAFRVKCPSLELGCNHDAGNAKLDSAALEFGNRALWVQRRNMRKSDESAGIIPLRLMHAIIDQAADSKVWLVKARAAGEHRDVDARPGHHPYMRGKIGKQGIKEVIGISIVVVAYARNGPTALQQFGRRVVMLEIDNHLSSAGLSDGGVRALEPGDGLTVHRRVGSGCDRGNVNASRHQFD